MIWKLYIVCIKNRDNIRVLTKNTSYFTSMYFGSKKKLIKTNVWIITTTNGYKILVINETEKKLLETFEM